jgi:hypothetical protein
MAPKSILVAAALTLLAAFCPTTHGAPVEGDSALAVRLADPQPYPAANAEGTLAPRAVELYSETSRTGVKGGCRFTFEDANTINHVRCNVADTKCDHNDVYAYLEAQSEVLPWVPYEVGKVRNSRGCNTGAVYGGRDDQVNPLRITLKYARVVVCVDDAGVDSCTKGARWINPYV